MDNWAAHELALPTVPTPYFTTPYDLRPAQPVTAQLRKQLTALPASVTEVDMLVCDSAPRRAGDFSLWFSLRYAVALIDANGDVAETPEQAVYQRVEPNLLDTGFTFMYYPPPVNFTNEFVTGGPLQGGTQVVIEGSGFTKGYRNESEIDLSQLIVRRPRSTPATLPPEPGQWAAARGCSCSEGLGPRQRLLRECTGRAGSVECVRRRRCVWQRRRRGSGTHP